MNSNKLPLIQSYNVLLFDLDGVIYKGNSPVIHAVKTLNILSNKKEICIVYITNNASKSIIQIDRKLINLGIINRPKRIISSVQPTIEIVKNYANRNDKVLILGSEYLKRTIKNLGFKIANSSLDSPKILIQGLSPLTSWTDLAEACYALSKNKIPWIVTNMDKCIPKERGFAPGNGALVDLIKNTTGHTPIVAGKPEPKIFQLALKSAQKYLHSFNKTTRVKPLVIGDRLDTDIFGGNKLSIDTALVLTGVDSIQKAILASKHQRPKYIFGNLSDLLKPYPSIYKHNKNAYRCGSWSAHIDSNKKIITNFCPKKSNFYFEKESKDARSSLNKWRAICNAWWNTFSN